MTVTTPHVVQSQNLSSTAATSATQSAAGTETGPLSHVYGGMEYLGGWWVKGAPAA
jgi:hypothetical protein